LEAERGVPARRAGLGGTVGVSVSA